MKNKIYGRIYLITNLITNKQYIGQTTMSVEFRFKTHCNGKPKQVISKSIRKYGRENFKVEEIYISFNKDDLDSAEQQLIINYNTKVPNGYNVEAGGSSAGKKTPEQLKEMSDRMRKWVKEHPDFNKGRKASEVTKARMSESQKKVNSEKKNKMYRKRQESIGYPIKAKNLNTGEIKEYKIVPDCAKDLGLQTTRIIRTLNNKETRITYKGYIFAKIDEEFPDIPKPKYISKHTKRNGYVVKVGSKYVGYAQTYKLAEIKLKEYLDKKD